MIHIRDDDRLYSCFKSVFRDGESRHWGRSRLVFSSLYESPHQAEAKAGAKACIVANCCPSLYELIVARSAMPNMLPTNHF